MVCSWRQNPFLPINTRESEYYNRLFQPYITGGGQSNQIILPVTNGIDKKE